MDIKTIDRRDFIKKSTLLASGMLTAKIGNGFPPKTPVSQSSSNSDSNSSNLISLPKGGSISGMGESFKPDPFTGSERISFGFDITKGRDALITPSLELSYSHFNGNGIFGFGWGFSSSKIQIKTNNKLPLYSEMDNYLLNGDELIPVLDNSEIVGKYEVKRYIQRNEKSFSRIEHWIKKVTSNDAVNQSNSFWKVTTRDNITDVYGITKNTVLINPNNESQLFQWNVELRYDNKGNAIHYVYKQDRNFDQEEVQLYPKKIKYSNIDPIILKNENLLVSFLENGINEKEFFCEIIFDYGEHITIQNGDCLITDSEYIERKPWDLRNDSFHSFRSGFKISTKRLCKRLLLTHLIPGKGKCLVKSMDLAFGQLSHNNIAILKSVTKRGYLPSKNNGLKFSEDYLPGKNSGVVSNFYEVSSLPAIEFDYSSFIVPDIKTDFVTLGSNGTGIPPGESLTNSKYILIDLKSRGLPDILETTYEKYYYWENKGNCSFAAKKKVLQNAPIAPVTISLDNSSVGIAEVNGDNMIDFIATTDGKSLGYCKHIWKKQNGEEVSNWSNYKEFSFPFPDDIDFSDKNLKFLDLTGDGTLDAMRIHNNYIILYEIEADKGFRKTRVISIADIDQFPSELIETNSVFLADMSGDGLMDLVYLHLPTQIIYYWPNLGYGNFGKRVEMGSLDVSLNLMDLKHLHFIDLDGTGSSDALYIDSDKIYFWFNNSGNNWNHKRVLSLGMWLDRENTLISDLEGNGISGILWSLGGGFKNNYYLRLTKTKPGLLKKIDNNLGKIYSYKYKTASQIALDNKDFKWIGKLPTPLYFITEINRFDVINNNKLTSKFKYYYPNFDDEERMFIGFAYIEQTDSENIKTSFDQEPVLRKYWFSNGLEGSYYEPDKRYYKGDDRAFRLREINFPGDISVSEFKYAKKAAYGSLIREEIYSINSENNISDHPFSVIDYNYQVKLEQKENTNRKPSFFTYQTDKLSHIYERVANDPKVNHLITLRIDKYGNILENAEVKYPRRISNSIILEQQKELKIIYNFQKYCDPINSSEGYRHSVLCENEKYELLTWITETNDTFNKQWLAQKISAAELIPFNKDAEPNKIQKRLLNKIKIEFGDDVSQEPLPLCICGLLALERNKFRLAFLDDMLQEYKSHHITHEILKNKGGYFKDHEGWWIPDGNNETGHRLYDSANFYLVKKRFDPFKSVYTTLYDDYNLIQIEEKDPLDNTYKAKINYYHLAPEKVYNPNNNIQEVLYNPLGKITYYATSQNESDIKRDNLNGLTGYLTPENIKNCYSNPIDCGGDLLNNATKCFIYNYWSIFEGKNANSDESIIPPYIQTLERESHVSTLNTDNKSRIKHTFSYFDGFKRKVLTKLFVEENEDQKEKWIGTEKKIYNNKGNVVKQFEPYPSDNHLYDLKEYGTYNEKYYDPFDRLTRQSNSDGALRKTTYLPWSTLKYDENDNIDDGLSTWKKNKAGTPEYDRIINLTQKHKDTPMIEHSNQEGNTILIEQNNADKGVYKTLQYFNAIGNKIKVIDARNNLTEQIQYDMLARSIKKKNADSGETLILFNALDLPIYTWDLRGYQNRFIYDKLNRPEKSFYKLNSQTEKLYNQRLYGENLDDTLKEYNLKGKLFREYDGKSINEFHYDFKSNITKHTRHYIKDASNINLENINNQVINKTLNITKDFNAFNIPVQVQYPDKTIEKRDYNLLGLLVKASIRKSNQNNWQVIVRNIEYNARNQKTKIQYANSTSSLFEYDEHNYRLNEAKTIRHTDSRTTMHQQYYYDPVGNVLLTRDKGFDTVYNNNQQIKPETLYEYDAIYRLIYAMGREQKGLRFHINKCNDVPCEQTAHINDWHNLQNYEERYFYDEVGNVLEVKHKSLHDSFTRKFNYKEENNHLKAFNLDNTGVTENIFSDENGNMIKMPHLNKLEWDYDNLLIEVQGNENSASKTNYFYDSAGIRILKEGKRNSVRESSFYMVNYETYERTGTNNELLSRETIKIMLDDTTILALSESISETNKPQKEITRYQLSNLTNTITFELDNEGSILFHEEFLPFGSTSYCKKSTDISLKNYRYQSKEKDDETSFYYFGARYYVSCYMRWCNPDPAGSIDGYNLFVYNRNNPVNRFDKLGLADSSIHDNEENLNSGSSEKSNRPNRNESWANVEGPGNTFKCKTGDVESEREDKSKDRESDKYRDKNQSPEGDKGSEGEPRKGKNERDPGDFSKYPGMEEWDIDNDLDPKMTSEGVAGDGLAGNPPSNGDSPNKNDSPSSGDLPNKNDSPSSGDSPNKNDSPSSGDLPNSSDSKWKRKDPPLYQRLWKAIGEATGTLDTDWKQQLGQENVAVGIRD